MVERERLAQFEIAQDSTGSPVEVARIPGEIVCLGFDTGRRRLVQIHLPKFADCLGEPHKIAFFARVLAAAEFRGDPTFTHVIDGGEDHGLAFYVTDVDNGEPVATYTQRYGPLRSATVTVLGLELVERLIDLMAYPELAAGTRLGGALLMIDDAGQLFLRVVDFGLGMRDVPQIQADHGERSLVYETGALLFQMFTGIPYKPGARSAIDALPALPQGLKFTLAHALGESTGPCRLEALRDALHDALPSEVKASPEAGRRLYAKLSVAKPLRSKLDSSFSREHGLPDALQERFLTEEDALGVPGRYIHTLYDMNEGHRVSVQVLPPERIISPGHYDAIPQSMWRQDDARHPNILRAVGLWETDQSTLLAEERWPGPSLSYLLAHRGTLESSEVALVLEQLLSGLDQAAECGLRIPSLHPSNIQLALGQDAAPREVRDLIDARLSAWPMFVVKIRGHFAVPTLIEQPLHESLFPQGSYGEGMSYSERITLETIALSHALIGARRFSVLTGGRSEDIRAYVEKCLAQEAAEPGSVDLHAYVEGFCSIARSGTLTADPTREGARKIAFGPPVKANPSPSPFRATASANEPSILETVAEEEERDIKEAEELAIQQTKELAAASAIPAMQSPTSAQAHASAPELRPLGTGDDTSISPPQVAVPISDDVVRESATTHLVSPPVPAPPISAGLSRSDSASIPLNEDEERVPRSPNPVEPKPGEGLPLPEDSLPNIDTARIRTEALMRFLEDHDSKSSSSKSQNNSEPSKTASPPPTETKSPVVAATEQNEAPQANEIIRLRPRNNEQTDTPKSQSSTEPTVRARIGPQTDYLTITNPGSKGPSSKRKISILPTVIGLAVAILLGTYLGKLIQRENASEFVAERPPMRIVPQPVISSEPETFGVGAGASGHDEDISNPNSANIASADSDPSDTTGVGGGTPPSPQKTWTAPDPGTSPDGFEERKAIQLEDDPTFLPEALWGGQADGR